MRCRRCGHENAPGANYCSSCGAALVGIDDTTVALAAIEDRQELEAELGNLLTELPAGMGMLVVRRGPNAGSTYVLDADTTTVGRHPDSDLFLDDVTVSRRHAVIRRASPETYEIADVGSLNGTYVDHVRIESAPLQDMNEIQIGRFVLTFVLGSGSAAPASAANRDEGHT
ncbi:MAG: FHA domain-containing protein [Actinobacteria bacterium]|nr:MAG: FHA domain-containing protein [Actinomycetota bacterium]